MRVLIARTSSTATFGAAADAAVGIFDRMLIS